MADYTSQIDSKVFIEATAYLLRETFEGSPEGQPSAYLDRGIGLFSTLEELSAAAASEEVQGTTVAGQTEPAKFYLDRLWQFINGRTESVNWDDSWLIEDVDDNEWTALQTAVRKAYMNSLQCLAVPRDWTQVQVGMAIGLVAHTAYPLGAIRQLSKLAK